MITNTSDQEATIRAFVVAAGVTYTFADTTVKPGTTTLFDVDAVRSAKVPDSMGHRIPEAALSGKFHWAPMPQKGPSVGLQGRTELVSVRALRASSFSCGAGSGANRTR